MSETSINIEDEQIKITNRINSIKNSGVFHLKKLQKRIFLQVKFMIYLLL